MSCHPPMPSRMRQQKRLDNTRDAREGRRMSDANLSTLPGRENRVAFLCAAVLVLEGFDLCAMPFPLPSIAESWHLKPVAFTAALTAGSIGLFLGSLLCGWLGDRVGR